MNFEKVKVQIVEDEGIVALDLRNRLTKLGYEVTATYACGEDALLFTNQKRPDIVLMDINLQGKIDGITTAHQLRKDHDLPIIFLTAYSDDNTLKRARITEAYGYLVKPCADKELRVAIEIGIYKAKADAKLRALQRWLAATMRSLGDGVIGTDLNHRINYMNPVAEKLTGWNFDQARNVSLNEVFKIIDESTRAPIISPVERALTEGTVVLLEHKTLLIRRDGTEVPIDDSCAPNLDDDGKPQGAVLIFRDATPLREAHSEVMRSREIALRNEKLAALGKIAGGVAHDVNNLMTVVTGYADLVLSEVADEGIARRLRAVIDAGLKASGVAQNLLKYSKQMPVKMKSWDLNEIVLDMKSVLEALARDKVKVTFDLCKAPLPVRVDSSQVCQILLNLGVNACEALEGGGTIHFATRAVEVPRMSKTHGLMRAGPAAQLLVSDTGCGMDDTVKAQLFEPYFTRKKAGKGTGLGLATVAGIVTQYEGHVAVESEPGKGSVFNVFIPFESADAQSRQ